MTENQSEKNPREDHGAGEDSLLDNLKQAGASLGGVFSEFAGNYRTDRAADADAGEHALHDPVTDTGTAGEQLRAAGTEARQKLSEGSGFGAVRDAAGSIAGSAGNIFRDVAGSVSRAADATFESEAGTEARQAFSGAFSSVRDRVGGDAGRPADVAGEDKADIIEGEVISSETTDAPVEDDPDSPKSKDN